MSRYKLTLAIVLVIATLSLVALVSKSSTDLRLHQLDLQTRDQRIEIEVEKSKVLEKEVEEAKGDKKKLEEADRKLKEQETLIKELQARKAEKQRIAQAEASNVVLASPETPTAPTGDCATWMNQAGITHVLARELIQRESGCDPNAVNPSSGACGIPQALPCSKLPNGINTSPVDQLIWMQNYVYSRYTTWDNAISFHNQNNWY